MNNLIELTKVMVEGLISSSDSVSVKEFESDDENTILIEVMVSADDMAKVIGHGGKTINAIRTLVDEAASMHNDGFIKIEVEKMQFFILQQMGLNVGKGEELLNAGRQKGGF